MKENTKYNIPIWQRIGITIEEAAEYSLIGTQKLRSIISDNPELDFIIHKGGHIIIKRPQFEKWIESVNFI